MTQHAVIDRYKQNKAHCLQQIFTQTTKPFTGSKNNHKIVNRLKIAEWWCRLGNVIFICMCVLEHCQCYIITTTVAHVYLQHLIEIECIALHTPKTCCQSFATKNFRRVFFRIYYAINLS